VGHRVKVKVKVKITGANEMVFNGKPSITMPTPKSAFSENVVYDLDL